MYRRAFELRTTTPGLDRHSGNWLAMSSRESAWRSAFAPDRSDSSDQRGSAAQETIGMRVFTIDAGNDVCALDTAEQADLADDESGWQPLPNFLGSQPTGWPGVWFRFGAG
jgi:hypothetical protein